MPSGPASSLSKVYTNCSIHERHLPWRRPLGSDWIVKRACLLFLCTAPTRGHAIALCVCISCWSLYFENPQPYFDFPDMTPITSPPSNFLVVGDTCPRRPHGSDDQHKAARDDVASEPDRDPPNMYRLSAIPGFVSKDNTPPSDGQSRDMYPMPSYQML